MLDGSARLAYAHGVEGSYLRSAAGLVAMLVCMSGGSGGAVAPESPPPLGGCAHRLTDGTCLVSPGAPLRIRTSAPILVRWGPAPWPVIWASTPDGAVGTLPAPPGGRLWIGDRAVTLAAPPRCPIVEGAAGLSPAALTAHLAKAAPPTDPRCAALRSGLAARALLRSGRFDEALTALDTSAAQALAVGLRSAWRDDGLAAAFVATWHTRALDHAAALLATRADDPDPVGRSRVCYAEAQLALERGRIAAALHALDCAARQRAGLETAEDLAAIRLLQAMVLRRLGRYRAAERSLDALLAAPGPLRARALVQRAANRVHWAAADPQAPAPDLALEAAREQLGADPQGDLPAALHLNVARWALWRHDVAAARRALAEGGAVTGHLAEWGRLLEAEASALEGDAEPLERLAHDPDDVSDRRWYAAVALGRLAARAGRWPEAAARFAEAEQVAHAQWILVPPGAGRGAAATARGAATTAQVEALLAAGDVDGAAATLRSGRSAWIASLSPDPADLNRGTLEALSAEEARLIAARRLAPAAEQPTLDRAGRNLAARRAALTRAALTAPPGRRPGAPPAGALFLVFATGPAGPTLILQTAAGSTAAPLGPRPAESTPAALGRWLLEPAADALRAHREIWLFPGIGFDELDLHALPIDGRPLALWRPTLYGLDLPPGREAARGGTLLIRDPRGDLPGARAAHWPGARVLHQRGAIPAAIRARPAERLIFAGHAVAAGVDGWQSALWLAGGARLTASDVLLAPWIPREALLLACRAAAQRSEAEPALGMAQAFLAAGSQLALGASRPLDDALAARILADLASHAGTLNLPAALSQALAREAAAHPGGDWAALRLWGRAPAATTGSIP